MRAREREHRERLLNAAVQLFARHGVAAVNVAEICRSADVPKGSFYHAWPSKQALLLEAIERYVEEHTARIRAAIEDAPTLRQQLRRMFVRLQTLHEERKQASGGVMPGCTTENLVLELSGRDDEVRRRLEAVYEGWHEELRTAFEAGVQRGEIDVDPHDAASATLAALQGGTLLARTANDPARLGAVADSFLSLLPWRRR